MQKLNFNQELSNIDIEEICGHLGIKLNGIYMRDQMTSDLRNGNYIINLDSSTGSGTHWCCFVKSGRSIYYMDSFGVVPPQEQVEIFHINQDKVFYNDEQMQHIKSVVCGFYCIAFFLFLKHTPGSIQNKTKKFADLFGSDYRANDELIKKMILKYY